MVRWSEPDRCYLAEAPALQGCRTHGDTPEAALRHCFVAAELWLEEALAHGDPIPLPTSSRSGKLTLRLPPSLHQRVALSAERDRVSVNQWIVSRLGEHVG